MALSVAEVRAALAEGDEGIRQGAIARLDLVETGAVALLVQAMADESWRVRREAVQCCGSGVLPTSVLVPVLVPVLAEPDDVGKRNAVIEAVVALGEPAVDALHAALTLAPAHRKVLCDVLGRIGAARSAGALCAFLHDEDSNVRIAAAEALGRLAPSAESDPACALVARSLLEALAALGGEAEAFLGTALLDALARRHVELPVARLHACLPQAVLGSAALRALASGAAPLGGDERAQARAAALGQLGHASRARREAAILALATLADDTRVRLDEAARAATTEALLEGTLEVQRAAARVLGASGDARAARPLLVAVEDSALEAAATDALGLLAERDLEALSVVTGTLAENGRTAIYRALARQPAGRATLPGLLDVLARDLIVEDEAVALAAIEALAARGGPDAAAALAAALVGAEALGTDGHDRAVAARQALAALAVRYPDAVAKVVRGRTSAPFVALLGELGGADDVAVLADQLSAPDVDVRRAAAGALAALAARRIDVGPQIAAHASDAARMALVDESPGVRAAAAIALARLEARRPLAGSSVVDGLLLAARDEDARVRGAAARALVELGEAAIVRADQSASSVIRVGLRALADGADPLTSVPALEALLAQRDDGDDARLLDALTGPDEERRKVALYALVRRPQLLVRGELLSLAERALHDARWDLRRAAIAALAAVGGAGRPALVARRSIEADPLVRADLDRALESGSRP